VGGGMLDLTTNHSSRRAPSFRPHVPTAPAKSPSNIAPSEPVRIEPGIYQIRFVGGSDQNFGEGIAVLKDGKINGGDMGYVYRGSYERENGYINAKINVKRWNVVPNALINLAEYDLIVEGQRQAAHTGFLIHARIQQQPNIAIQVEGKRIEDAF
jgi:hypothetical protein